MDIDRNHAGGRSRASEIGFPVGAFAAVTFDRAPDVVSGVDVASRCVTPRAGGLGASSACEDSARTESGGRPSPRLGRANRVVSGSPWQETRPSQSGDLAADAGRPGRRRPNRF
ncbi:MAG: hypothetical protein DME09_02610 [Candidatus Rokuibacteriota bacterium]|nr:MAG: hypothetical protein DME09_02610 [Candidatus Rokubacteria bacterium]